MRERFIDSNVAVRYSTKIPNSYTGVSAVRRFIIRPLNSFMILLTLTVGSAPEARAGLADCRELLNKKIVSWIDWWENLGPSEVSVKGLRETERKLLTAWARKFDGRLDSSVIIYAGELRTVLERFNSYVELLANLLSKDALPLSDSEADAVVESVARVDSDFLAVIDAYIWENIASPRTSTPNRFSLYAKGTPLLDPYSPGQPPNFRLVLAFHSDLVRLRKLLDQSFLSERGVAAGIEPEYVVTVDTGIHITSIHRHRHRAVKVEVSPDARARLLAGGRTAPRISIGDVESAERRLLIGWVSASNRLQRHPELIAYASNFAEPIDDFLKYVSHVEDQLTYSDENRASVAASIRRVEEGFLKPLDAALRDSLRLSLPTPNHFTLFARGNVFSDDSLRLQPPNFKRVFLFNAALFELGKLKSDHLSHEAGLLKGLAPYKTITYDQNIHMSGIYRFR